MNKKEVLAKLEQQFKLNLNGDWESFKTSLEHLRFEVDEMSQKDVKLLKKALCDRINGKCDINTGDKIDLTPTN